MGQNSWNSPEDAVAAGMDSTFRAGVTGLILLGWDVWPVGPRIPHSVCFLSPGASEGTRVSGGLLSVSL